MRGNSIDFQQGVPGAELKLTVAVPITRFQFQSLHDQSGCCSWQPFLFLVHSRLEALTHVS